MNNTSPPNVRDDMSRIDKARDFAIEKHHGQTRDAVARMVPYINHPLEVAAFVREAGCDDETVCAALLHDVIEDCGVTHGELVGLFGETIADVVLELTDDPRLSKTQRRAAQIKHASEMSFRARCVKVADKASNVKSLPTSGWATSAIRGYLEHAEKVCDECATSYITAWWQLQREKKDAQLLALLHLARRELVTVREWLAEQEKTP